jgi:cytochrome c-type biogenesis protein CcmH
MKAVRLVLGCCLLASALALAAKEAAPEAADPALEARMVRITSELRCLVCQNQTIADSNASLAVDLRREARELLKQGKSDAEVVDYMTARYGDFVLYRPPMRATTLLLWFGPALMLAGGAAVLVIVLRRRSRMAADAFDADDELAEEPGAVDAALTSSNAGAPGPA